YSDEAVRKRMLPSLLRTHPLIGSGPEQVNALLGSPMERAEYVYYVERFENLAPDEMVYWIGPEEGFMRFDSIWLILSPGRNGAIEQYRVAYGGIQEVRNPPCGHYDIFRNEIVRIDESNRRIFVAASATDLDGRAGAPPVLHLIRAYAAKCHPG